MKITLGNLKVGMKIFHVHAFSDDRKILNTWIDEYEVVKFPITVTTSKEFIRLKLSQMYTKADFGTMTWERRKYSSPGETEKAMQDMGIIPNNYNQHQTFDSLAEAKHYICNFNQVNFKEPVATNYDRAMGVLDI